MTDTLNAFVEDGEFRIEPIAPGVLDGMEFVAKDLFDVAGHVTGGGNPDWAAQTEKASRHAWGGRKAPVRRCCSRWKKPLPMKFLWAYWGKNAFYGTPVNSAAPDRVPGGSSSGTAGRGGRRRRGFWHRYGYRGLGFGYPQASAGFMESDPPMGD